MERQIMESPIESPPGSLNNMMSNLYDSEGGRGCRSKRKHTNPTFCPVCKCTLRLTDVDQHLNCELEKLQKISKARRGRPSNGNIPTDPAASRVDQSSPSSSSGSPPSAQPSEEQYKKYKQVRSNRKSRQKAKTLRRKKDDVTENRNQPADGSNPGPSRVSNFDEGSHGDIQCPLCYRYYIRIAITDHVDDCLNRAEERRKRKRDDGDDSSPESSTEDDNEGEAAIDDYETNAEYRHFGEYEWAGETRVRATSLVPGGACTLFSNACVARSPLPFSNSADSDEDLVVDDEDRFGPAQFSESDIIQCNLDMHREQNEETLRRAVLTPIIPPSTDSSRHNGRVFSQADPTRNEAIESNEDTETPAISIESNPNSDQTHPPHTSSDALPEPQPGTGAAGSPDEGGNDSADSLVTVPSPQPPQLDAIDMGPPPAGDHDISRSAPLLQSVHGFFQHRNDRLMVDIERLDMERLLGLPDPIETHPSSLLNLIPGPSTDPLTAVPSLRTMAESVAALSANPTPSTSSGITTEASSKLIIQSLTARIHDLENRLHQDTLKCLICLDRYDTPVVSTTCWHVHCKECWISTLGMKKLCPQCNAITTAGDLRRIYI